MNPQKYSVWDNRTDELIILDGTPRQCAEAMKLKGGSNGFHHANTLFKKGKITRWHIEESRKENDEND